MLKTDERTGVCHDRVHSTPPELQLCTNNLQPSEPVFLATSGWVSLIKPGVALVARPLLPAEALLPCPMRNTRRLHHESLVPLNDCQAD